MSEQLSKTEKFVPPPGFEFNDDLLEDYDEQVRAAIADALYQAKPVASFEAVPKLDIRPTFNPTNAPEGEVFARGRMPASLRPHKALRSEWSEDPRPVEMWRVVERSSLEDGTGLVSSRILQGNNLGDVEGFNAAKHLASHHEGRMSSADAATPFVSFSTDPENLAREVILRHGFGIKGGRDSVVVRVLVDPDRVITGSKNKNPEVLLLGGVAPGEFDSAYSLSDFITNLVPENEVTTITGEVLQRDQALGHWALQGAAQS